MACSRWLTKILSSLLVLRVHFFLSLAVARYVSIDFVRFQTHSSVAGPASVRVGDDVLAPFPGDGANSYPFLYPAKVRYLWPLLR